MSHVIEVTNRVTVISYESYEELSKLHGVSYEHHIKHEIPKISNG